MVPGTLSTQEAMIMATNFKPLYMNDAQFHQKLELIMILSRISLNRNFQWTGSDHESRIWVMV